MTTAPTMPHNSIKWCQSRPFRVRRRCFDTEDGPHLPGADVRHESLECRALRQTRPRAAEILIDDHDVLEAQLTRRDRPTHIGVVDCPGCGRLGLVRIDARTPSPRRRRSAVSFGFIIASLDDAGAGGVDQECDEGADQLRLPVGR